MSDSVENKIVSIQFDNAAFQSKMNETIKALDNLRKSLDFKNAKKGLDDINASGKKIDLSGLEQHVGGIASKFTALGLIGIGALTSIGAAGVSAGVNLVKSFSFGPIIDGFHEFETNMNSIQTILANTSSKGTTLSQVSDALQVLNTYSDKTIYNFTQMARNIGTFTAAGIDLKPATQAIKGIANLAAVSGSNADQASTAMYQLSQALASGTLKLMDWNSVVNAGMGGAVFQKALFETGKALGTLKNVPMKQTFEQWTKANGSFRESLKDGWVTADVLTTTLAGFTGDMTEAQLKAKGFTEQQAKEILRMGKVALDAATKVKTFTQLMSTIKEAIGSGWTQSFQLLFGNFNEARDLFTGINDVVSGFFIKMAKARNQTLTIWKNFGGRTALIEAFKNVFKSIAAIVRQVTSAFREFFPKTTGEKLIKMTATFLDFSKNLKMGGETLTKIKNIFRGFFAGLSIGFTIVKELANLFKDVLFGALGLVGPKVLDFSDKTGSAVANLQKILVTGGGIHKFFLKLRDVLVAPIKYLGDLSDKIRSFFSEKFGDNRITSRLDQIGKTAKSVGTFWDRFSEKMQGVRKVLNSIFDYIRNWFAELGHKLADAFHPGDFNALLDVINVGLLGGIVLLLRKFLKQGLKIDIGGGLVDKIKKSFDTLTGTLKAMQTNLKAQALEKIAIAVGILVASLVVLSLIDSKKLTKALLGLSVSFGELIGAMTVLDKMNFKTGILKLNGIAAAMILIATAAVILSAAIKIMSTMDLGSLAKGLAGVAGGLALLVGATRLIGGSAPQLIAAGIAMIAISTALLILSAAVKAFSLMDMGTMGRGLIGISLGLLAISAAMNLMPPSSVISGLGFIEIAIGLNILAGAVKLFSLMDMGAIGKGLIGITLALVGIAAAMQLMPITLPITAAGVLILSVALAALAGTLKLMSTMKFGDMIKGIGGIALMLGVLAIAMQAMSGTLLGAVSLIIVANSLLILTHVLKELGKLSLGQLATGLGAIVGVIALLALISNALSSAIPAMMGMGVALTFIGAGFALFGLGVMLVAKGLETLATSGVAGAKAFVGMLKVILAASSDIADAAAIAALHFVEDILKALPLLIRLIEAVLEQLIETIIKEAPKLAKGLVVIITEWLKVVRTIFPDIVATGIEMLLAFLNGIRANIEEITNTAIDIIVEFLNAIANRTGDITEAGVNIIIAFLEGVTTGVGRIEDSVFSIITAFIAGLGRGANSIVTAGVNIIISFIRGIGSNAVRLANAAGKTIVDFLNGLANAINKYAPQIRNAGLRVIFALINGMTFGLLGGIKPIITFFAGLGGKVIGWVGDVSKKLVGKGISLIAGLLTGIAQKWIDIVSWLVSLPGKLISWIPNPLEILKNIGLNIIEGLWNGMKSGFDKVKGWLGKVGGWIVDIKGPPIKDAKILIGNGMLIMQGLQKGLTLGWDDISNWMSNLGSSMNIGTVDFSTIKDTLNEIPKQIEHIEEFQPTITPVLDLTQVKSQANTIGDFFSIQKISPEVSLDQAKSLSVLASQKSAETITPESTGPSSVIFNQTNNSPKALSVGDIYRQSKSQIVLAKQELGVS